MVTVEAFEFSKMIMGVKSPESFESIDKDEYEEILKRQKEEWVAESDARKKAAVQFWIRTLSNDKSLHDWIGFDLKCFTIIWLSFQKKYVEMECAEIKRKIQCVEKRAGKRGPRPRADIIADKENNIPLIHDYSERSESAGNRCSLDLIYILIMALVRKYRNFKEIELAPLFGVDQSTVSRNLVWADKILAEILPTPRKFMKVLASIDTPEKFASLFPNGEGSPTIVVDGTHVRVHRPQNKEKRDPMISSKKKFPSGNTMFMGLLDGLIMAIGKTHNGSVHDMTLLRELLPQLGKFGKMLQGEMQADVDLTLPKPDDTSPQVTPDTPRKKDKKKVTKKPRDVIPNAVTRAMHALFCLADVQQSIECAMCALCDRTDEQRETTDAMTRLKSTTKGVMKIYADAGFQGSDKDMKGADVHHTLKKPKNKELIDEKKAYNCELSKERITIENAIGAAKHFQRIATIYNADLDQLNDEINIACGLANLRNMLRNGTYYHWALILGLCIKL